MANNMICEYCGDKISEDDESFVKDENRYGDGTIECVYYFCGDCNEEMSYERTLAVEAAETDLLAEQGWL